MIAERRAALTLAAAITAATLAVAIVVRLALAAEVRRRLDFGFAGVPATPEAALSIFAANARLLAVVFAAIAITQIAWRRRRHAAGGVDRHAARARGRAATRSWSAPRSAPTAPACSPPSLPHGPVELAVFALALALYLRARRAQLPRRHIAAVAATCVSGLALAAALETFAAP